MVQLLCKTVWRFLKELKLLCDPAIPLLDIYLKEMTSLPQRYVYTPTFIAALFLIDKTQKQLKCLQWVNG